MIGLFGGLALLMIFTMKGVNLLIAAPLTAFFVALLSGIAIFPQMANAGEANFITSYMGGFSGFIASWFIMFLLGAIFGKLMEDSGAAESIAAWIIGKIGVKKAALAIVMACAVLTYGGVSLFVVAFSVYPMAVSLFKGANIPRRFIPAALAFGSTTFTMTSAGSPEIQNWIPIQYLHTSPYAAWEVSVIVAIFMMCFGYIWLRWMIARSLQKGEYFVSRETDLTFSNRPLPNPYVCCIPLVVVLALSLLFHDLLAESALIVALLGGCIAAYLLNRKYFFNVKKALSDGALGAIIAIANTAAVVGFGGLVKVTPAFLSAVDFMTNLPGNPLIGSAIAISVIAGITGSASGGQAIALPLLAPHYLDMGVNPEALHRIASISSGTIDSLPHGGYVVTTIRAIAGETHRDAYPAFGALTVVIPAIGVVLALLLFSVGL
ncbi:MAG: SLC13 family permease [Cyclobacteriaceae bacterium]